MAVAELKSCDFHHDSLVSLPSVPSALQDATHVCGEAMAVGATKSSTFLGDTGASHNIVCKREYFTKLSPLPGAINKSGARDGGGNALGNRNTRGGWRQREATTSNGRGISD